MRRPTSRRLPFGDDVVGDQLVLEILLHDRLADRLDGAAGSLVRPVERIQQSLYISPPELSQIAAIEAFTATAELEAVKARYARNRELLMRRLPELGFRAGSADGRRFLCLLRCLAA